jgi:hypothetical protein
MRHFSFTPAPAQSLNYNSRAERFAKTIKDECLDNLVLFPERHLRIAVKEFMAHYQCRTIPSGLVGQLSQRPQNGVWQDRVPVATP